MSFHDDLTAEVANQKDRYKRRVHKVEQAMGLLHRALPKFFGGVERDYGFRHPTRPGEQGRNTLASNVLPEEGSTFVTALIVEAGTRFVYFLRFSDFEGGGTTVTLLNWDNVSCKLSDDEGENAARLSPFCHKLFAAAKQTLSADHRLAVAKVVKVNQYEGKVEAVEE